MQAAIGRWADAGSPTLNSPRSMASGSAVADLGGSHLGLAGPVIVLIDDDAAGHGWFIDSTPFDDAEFGHALSATQLQTDPSGRRPARWICSPR